MHTVHETGDHHVHGNNDDQEYLDYLDRLTARFTANSSRPVFTTNVESLWDVYLDSFEDPIVRQYHNCHACRQFINRYGALVQIDGAGVLSSAVWSADDAPPSYQKAVANMVKAVRRAKVETVFLSSDATWGTPVTGEWRHFAVKPPTAIRYTRRTLTAGQAMAEKREDYLNVVRAIGEFSKEHVAVAVKLLKTDSLYRSEKVLGQAQWLADLHAAIELAHGSQRSSVIWLAVAQAPAGFCHPRSSMIMTLLEDIVAGMDYETVSRRFKDKMHPLQYQRHQAAPTAGAIEAAEKLVEKLGVAPSLERRFCRLDEIQAIWRPADVCDEPKASSVFGHLKPKGASDVVEMRVPAQTMTWDKFQKTVLPAATKIEVRAPVHGGYCAFVTAVHADAPPILQWDSEAARNPVSWYFWNGGAPASQFRLVGGVYHKLDAITLKPSMWNGGHEHQGNGVMFVISGAQETRNENSAIFPETLKTELHGARSVIESFSKSRKLANMEQPHVAGLMVGSSKEAWDIQLRVTSGATTSDYRLDRWD